MPRRGAKVLSRVPSIAALVALVCVVATGNDGVAQPLVLLSVMLAPTLLPRTLLYPPPASQPPDDGEDDGGGGPGPEPDPPVPPDAPTGGVPLPDARPAKVRRRDHDRPTLIPRRPRRATPEPVRAPRRRSPARPPDRASA
jgi:hypothetical protein